MGTSNLLNPIKSLESAVMFKFLKVAIVELIVNTISFNAYERNYAVYELGMLAYA